VFAVAPYIDPKSPVEPSPFLASESIKGLDRCRRTSFLLDAPPPPVGTSNV